MQHLHQNDFFLWNNLNQKTLFFSVHFQQVNVLSKVIFLLRLDSLASSNSVFVIKFTCANFALKTLGAKVLNSGVVIYLSWLWSVSFFLSSLIFVS